MQSTHEQNADTLIQDVLEYGANFTWPQYAERHGIVSGEAAQSRWKRYAIKNGLQIKLERKFEAKPPPHAGLEIKAVTLGKNGETVSERWGKQNTPINLPDFQGFELEAATTNPNGGAWLKYKANTPDTSWKSQFTAEQLNAFQDRLLELEKSQTPKSISPKLPKYNTYENWLIIGCAHVPSHNKFLWDGVLKYIETNEVNGIILAGDFLDLKSLSSHDSGKVHHTTLWDEYTAGRQAIIEIESVLPKTARKIHLYGNHEDRYLRTLERVENSRFGAALLSPMEGLKMEGWEVLNNWKEDYVLLGNSLEVIHGFYTNKTAAKSHLDASSKSGRSVILFHTHREEFCSNGKEAAWNCGSLADFKSPAFGYVPRHVRGSWRNGLCLATIDHLGEHYVTPIRCSETFFFVNGQKY